VKKDEIKPGDYVTVPKLSKNRSTGERVQARVKLIVPPYLKVVHHGREGLVEVSYRLDEAEKL